MSRSEAEYPPKVHQRKRQPFGCLFLWWVLGFGTNPWFEHKDFLLLCSRLPQAGAAAAAKICSVTEAACRRSITLTFK